ncbi:serine protease [Actinomadura sp. WMMB 499]|uniref:S1 family peptidase n=1 Tax=Actinomadura sp. WMMB 499 TaxID=1219491 RepID=UPI001246F702|nr:serine protease [Actinomadura sp. WMMB 499]QFG26625.1 trypsin-like peptidase domain-containing protein [Actinomadura sp. WMMB 499]
MLGRLGTIGLVSIALLAPATAAPAVPAAAAERPPAPSRHAAVDFTGIVALDNCSGSLVRGPRSRDGDPALVLTNGHCLRTGTPAAREVIVDRPSARTFTLLDRTGRGSLGTLRATNLEYATMADTDVAVYRLESTYAEIERRYGVPALQMSAVRPQDGTKIRIVSGYWRRIYACRIDGTVHRLREAEWTWKDSVRYGSGCRTIAGTSGSPVIDASTGRVVAVNNTGNEDGERCTLNNPCEVARGGQVTVRPGISYGQQTYPLARCLGAGSDVVVGGSCALPEPAGT